MTKNPHLLPTAFTMGLVTLWTSSMDEWARPIGELKSSYCGKWNLGYCYEEVPDEAGDICWLKISAILRLLSEYDWVIWINSDAIIMDLDVDPRLLCDSNYDLIMSRDAGGPNTGVFLIRSSKQSHDFFFRIWEKDWEGAFLGDFTMALMMEEIPDIRTKFVEKRTLSSNWEEYDHGDFILNAAGESDDTKRRLLTVALKISGNG